MIEEAKRKEEENLARIDALRAQAEHDRQFKFSTEGMDLDTKILV